VKTGTSSEGRPPTKPVTDNHLDAPDGAVVDGYERVGAVWINRLMRDHHWRRVTGPKRERGRIAVVVAVPGPPWNIVEYRYLAPLPRYSYGRNQGKIGPRTSKTSMSERDFLEAFEPLPGPLARRP
jgi:hypothetical protein